MFGPRTTSTFSPSAAGAMIMPSSMMNSFGGFTLGIAPNFETSGNSPVRALRAQISGLARITPASLLPARPRKLRLKERTLRVPVAGTWPMPIQGPQADSRMRAPEAISSLRPPAEAIISNTWRLPGVTVKLTSG